MNADDGYSGERPYQISHKTVRSHLITVSKDTTDSDWYIRVQAPSGCYAYDGWWRDSADKTKHQAIEEAKRGALLTGPKT